ncbi:type II toxin-antitoxin system Phd/YefM family antitoxin [Sphingomonas bacterium]|uniref:type II toxin-antitoxin system Phd/YefM family antitoxin n=1 Tax=Sphingomonas bacterium TaxID=1895847 RepID=UPI0015776851|nr:hypothetical protein [Sphingomonas bacterium]
MTIHVTISEAEKRLAELVAAVVRGEDVVLGQIGSWQARIVPIDGEADSEIERRRALRKSAFGMWKEELKGFDLDIPPSMTDEELEERWQRKFGPAA